MVIKVCSPRQLASSFWQWHQYQHFSTYHVFDVQRCKEMAIRLPKKFCLTPGKAMITYAWSDWTDAAETYQECSQQQHPFHLLWDAHEHISAHLPLWMVNWATGSFSIRHKTKKEKYTYLPQRLTNVYMELLKGWDVKQHIRLKENERLFLVQPMQLYVFCWGKFIATLRLSRRVVSHKDFQMPCVKFLISPTILKYIITQTQTSFKKYLSLKHVWPPCLALKRLSFFFSFLSFEATWETVLQHSLGA